MLQVRAHGQREATEGARVLQQGALVVYAAANALVACNGEQRFAAG